jgi:hypothetical protein
LPKNAPEEGLAPSAADEDGVIGRSCGPLASAGREARWPDRFRLVTSITSG